MKVLGVVGSFRKKGNTDTLVNKLLDESDGIVLGSPTYFYNVTGDIKKFLDRLYCYDTFDPSDRSVWVSVNEVIKTKYGVTVAICEQDNESDMGYTSITMDRSLEAVGYRVVNSLKVLHMFLKGEVAEYKNELDRSYLSGVKLGKTLLLAKKVRKSYNIGD